MCLLNVEIPFGDSHDIFFFIIQVYLHAICTKHTTHRYPVFGNFINVLLSGQSCLNILEFPSDAGRLVQLTMRRRELAELLTQPHISVFTFFFFIILLFLSLPSQIESNKYIQIEKSTWQFGYPLLVLSHEIITFYL